MNFEILGISRYDFKGKDGKRVCGAKLHLGYCDDRVEGIAVSSVSVSQSLASKSGYDLSSAKPGDVICISYFQNRIVSVSVVSGGEE